MGYGPPHRHRCGPHWATDSGQDPPPRHWVGRSNRNWAPRVACFRLPLRSHLPSPGPVLCPLHHRGWHHRAAGVVHRGASVRCAVDPPRADPDAPHAAGPAGRAAHRPHWPATLPAHAVAHWRVVHHGAVRAAAPRERARCHGGCHPDADHPWVSNRGAALHAAAHHGVALQGAAPAGARDRDSGPVPGHGAARAASRSPPARWRLRQAEPPRRSRIQTSF